MTPREPRVFTIPPGGPFLETLAESLLSGKVVPGFAAPDNPLALADATIFVPTRRAARALRQVFVDRIGTGAAILPSIRPLGEFDEDATFFDAGAEALDLLPPVGGMERLLLLAPLVQAWKSRLPAAIRARFSEDVVVPASPADAVWLSRDLAALIDEIDIEGADWKRLTGLVPDELANWWQVTLDFLRIATDYYPAALAERGRSSPGAHLTASIDAEGARLRRSPPAGPVIAAGSTGSIPATARLLATIARLPAGAVVLPGLDIAMDASSWDALCAKEPHPSICGHPQFGLRSLLSTLGIAREAVAELAAPQTHLAARRKLVAEALRPAETTDAWSSVTSSAGDAAVGLTFVEAANEREEADAIALALRLAIEQPGHRAALVTTDRALARRVATELARHGVRADDSGGRPLSHTPPVQLLADAVAVAAKPGNPVSLMSLIKHPLLRCGLPRGVVRSAAETIELVALRGGTGRPDIVSLRRDFDLRLGALRSSSHKPAWLARLGDADVEAARALCDALGTAAGPLVNLLRGGEVELGACARESVLTLETLGRDEHGALSHLYAGDVGEKLIAFLREILATESGVTFPGSDWPAMLEALIAGTVVKPPQGADRRVAIWGALEARLQSVETMVLGGMNEGSWPRRAEPDRFMSRFMKSGMSLQPPERRIGQAAHDLVMAMGAPNVVLTRAARAGDAPAVASRLIQRLLAFAGPERAAQMRARGETLIAQARGIGRLKPAPRVTQPKPAPPLKARPRDFSVTEIETLRRDPYAVYARRVLDVAALKPLLRDPNAAERGTLFHDILHRFAIAGIDPRGVDAEAGLVAIGHAVFAEQGLPADVEAVWWPRFRKLATGIIGWERSHRSTVTRRIAEARAEKTVIGLTRATLRGFADRIDILNAGHADILDYKTGSYPSKRQAHQLVVPQLALEGALLMRGAFGEIGKLTPDQLAYVRLRPNGEVHEESILTHARVTRTAQELSEDAWGRLEKLVAYYEDETRGYLSRALPFRAGDFSGDYDHLARVAEWSTGGDGEEEAE